MVKEFLLYLLIIFLFDDEDVKVKGFFFSFLNFLFVENTINKVFICKGCTFLFPLTCLFCSNKTKSLICLYSRLYCFLNFFSIERNMEERSQKNPYFLLLHYFVWCTMGETILDRTIFECRSTENVQLQIFNLNFYPLKITNMYFSNVLLLLMSIQSFESSMHFKSHKINHLFRWQLQR